MNLTAQTEADQNQSLPTNYSPLALEAEMREFWTKNNIRNKLRASQRKLLKGIWVTWKVHQPSTASPTLVMLVDAS